MIYLIEDKTSRRNDYGWTNEKISTKSDVITVIENGAKLIEMIPEILMDGNVVLFHESFAQKETSNNVEEINKIMSQIVDVSNTAIAYFSGSNSQRKIDGRFCSLNVDILYKNLDVFIEYYRQGITDFNYLLFGEDPQLESKLLQQIKRVNDANIEISEIESERKILAFLTSEEPIQFPISNATIKDDCDYYCSDADLSKLVEEQSTFRYDAIYIPLCMGETLSDYLGLRLAMFFKLSDTANKYAHIFIYGVVNSSMLLKNECVEVLKMPGVNYVLADTASLIKTTQLIRIITRDEYRLGLKSIHLNVPTNIGDNHSIANKWAISRWSLALGDSDKTIEKNNDDIYSSLYFRYLSALYPPKEVTRLDKDNLLIYKDEQNEEKSLPNLNILYVDDEADEGWYELLCNIIYDVNKINDFDYIGSQIKSMSEDEIINNVMNKVKSTNVNVVILDLRLHPNDFNDTSIKDITGYKLLSEIKRYNRGIQVLMFSATNKIWNLQALQKAEVDGFIMKEAPEISNGEDTTTQSICQLVNSLSECSRHTYRKSLWETIQNEKEHINKLRRKKKINLEYAKAVEVLLTMTEDALFSKDLQFAYATSFMNLFRIIEATANEWIDQNAVIEEKDSGEVRSYYKLRKDDSQLLEFCTNKYNPSPFKKLYYYRNQGLSYFQKICNTLHVVGAYNQDAYNIVTKRNNFTHPNLIENSEIEKFTIQDVLSVLNLVEQLIMNQQLD